MSNGQKIGFEPTRLHRRQGVPREESRIVQSEQEPASHEQPWQHRPEHGKRSGYQLS